MLPPVCRSLPTAVLLLASLLLAGGAGCGAGWPWLHGESGPLLESVKVSELRPGSYCEIDMVLPPLRTEGSFHCFKGTVKEVGAEEIVLTNVSEGSCIEYGTSSGRPAFTQGKRNLVHVPLAGVKEVWAFPPAKDQPPEPPPAKPSGVIALPSLAARPAPPPHDSAACFDAPPTIRDGR